MRRMRFTLVRGAALTSVLGLLLVAACAPPREEVPFDEPEPVVEEPAPEPEPPMATTAAASLLAADGSERGTVTFTQTGDQTTIVADVVDGPPGLRGIHVHEIGECEPPDFTSAGDHFDPTDAIHGGPTDPEHHAGDFGNIEIGDDGVGHLTLTTEALTVDPGPNSVVGRAVILHAGEDDLVSQPTGDSGQRFACGVAELESEMEEEMPELEEEPLENDETI